MTTTRTRTAEPPVLTDAGQLAARLLAAVDPESHNIVVSYEMHRVHLHIKHQYLDDRNQVVPVDIAARSTQLRRLAIALGSTVSGFPTRRPVGDIWGYRVTGNLVAGVQVTVQADLTLDDARRCGLLGDFDLAVADMFAMIGGAS